jgi:hypothetical protein
MNRCYQVVISIALLLQEDNFKIVPAWKLVPVRVAFAPTGPDAGASFFRGYVITVKSAETELFLESVAVND